MEVNWVQELVFMSESEVLKSSIDWKFSSAGNMCEMFEILPYRYQESHSKIFEREECRD